MTQKIWPTIRKRTETVKGRVYTYWLVDCGNVQGVRKRHSYKTLREAEKKAEELRRERSRIGKLALRLSDAQKLEAAEAYRLLGETGSLIEAVEFYIEHGPPLGE